MKKIGLIITIIAVLLIIGILVFFYYQNKSQKANVDNQQKTEETLTPTTTEPIRTPDSTLQKIKKLLAEKIKIKIEDVIIPTYRESLNHIIGEVKVDKKIHYFAAILNEDKESWTIVYEGEKKLPCDILNKNFFPSDMLEECVK